MKRDIKNTSDGLGPLSHRVTETFKGTTDTRAGILDDRIMQLLVGYSDEEIAACFVKHLEAITQASTEELHRAGQSTTQREVAHRGFIRRSARLNTWRIIWRTTRRSSVHVR